MYDFWNKLGNAYLMFSQFCSYDDWQNILKKIASEILAIREERSLAILDVGAGYGINTLALLNILFSQKHIRNFLDVVEPSLAARDLLSRIIVSESNGGVLRSIFGNISDINDKKYDVILFLHSSYYIDNFDEVLVRLIEQNLRENGKLIILAIPDDSDFFIDSAFRLPYTSSKCAFILSKKGIIFDRHSLESRFYINNKFVLSTTEIDQLYHFMTSDKCGVISKEEFCTKIKKRSKDGVLNFKDELLVIRKRR